VVPATLPVAANTHGVPATALIKQVVVGPGALFGSVMVNAVLNASWLISSSVELLVQRMRMRVDLAPPVFGSTV